MGVSFLVCEGGWGCEDIMLTFALGIVPPALIRAMAATLT